MMRVAITLVVTALVCVSGFAQERRGQERAGRAKQEKAVDWNARYEKLLEEDADIRAKVESGGATREQIIAWMKAQAKGRKKGAKKDDVGTRLEILLKKNPMLLKALEDGEITRKELIAKLKGAEWDRDDDWRGARGRRGPKTVDWNAKYKQFLKENPRVEAKVDSGAITKEQVIVGMKAREKETRKESDLDAEYRKWLEKDPGLRKAVEVGKISKEDLMEKLQFMVLAGKRPWKDDDEEEQRRRGDRPALEKKLAEFVKAGKVTREVAAILLETAFPKPRGWERARRDDRRRREVDRDRRRR